MADLNQEGTWGGGGGGGGGSYKLVVSPNSYALEEHLIFTSVLLRIVKV